MNRRRPATDSPQRTYTEQAATQALTHYKEAPTGALGAPTWGHGLTEEEETPVYT